MASLFLEVAVRAVLVAAGTAVVLWALQIRSAAVKHAAWTAVMLAMLALPIWQAGGVRLSLPILRPAPTSVSLASIAPPTVAADTSALPAPETPVQSAPVTFEVARSLNWQDLVAGLYLLGVVVLLARLFLGTIQANKLRRRAVMNAGRLTSDRCATPITVGWFRPALILPRDWPRWPAAKLAAVLTHEAEHARRHDPLVQWVALLNRAVFWCHPLSWWLERQLATLSEEACDAAVIAAGHSPEEYSGYLLDIARSMMREGRRLNVVGVAMPGSGLKQRLRYMFDGLPAARLSRTRIACTATLCVAFTALFAGATLTPRTSMAIDARPTSDAQTPASAVPRFDVVSVKPCDPNNPGSGGGSRGGGGGSISPGRLVENCLTLYNMMQNAYIRFADGRGHDPWGFRDIPIEGGPDWIRHDPYMVEATADGTISQVVMRGPMLQAVLEDRFRLKVHRKTRQGPVYDLVIAASGSKLKPAKDGVCVPPDWTVFPMPPLPDGQHRCGITGGPVDEHGAKLTAPPTGGTYTAAWDDEALSLDDLAKDFLHLDRPVVNKTGIVGLISFHLTHHFDRTSTQDSSPVGDAHAAAVDLKEQLGLELRPSTGPRDSLVIDHVERPVPNEQVGMPASAKAAAGEPAVAVAQARLAQSPKFDVASVKPCGPNATPGQGSRSGGAGGSNSPGYLFLNCLTLKQLVNMSSGHADDKLNILLRYRFANEFYPVVGGPSWVGTEQYTIEARAGGVLDRNMLTGPMLRALLEDRFELKTHAATKDMPIYLLKVADGGLRVAPVDPESCYELDPAKLPLPAGTLQNRHPCGIMSRMWGPFRMTAAKLGAPPKAGGSSLADELSPLMDRAVLDRTGLDARYDIEFAYTPDDRTPGYYHSMEQAVRPGMEAIAERRRQPETPEAANGPNIFKALENLGLKLEPVNYPVPYLVIDSAQRPKPDFAAGAAMSGRPKASGGQR